MELPQILTATPLAYLNEEWLSLPALDADHARLRVSSKGVVEALDEKGYVKYELDAQSFEWKIVEATYQLMVPKEYESGKPPLSRDSGG